MTRLAIMVLACLVLAACGPAEEPASGPPADEPAGEPADEPAEAPLQPDTPVDDRRLSGTLGGDPELEGGCAWLDTTEGRYEVLYPDGYEIAFDPVRLVGPDGEVLASEGDPLTLEGHEDPEILTFCQVGPIFRATSVTAG